MERELRPVTIHSIEVVEGSADRWTLDVACSKGTYIRTLAEGIGRALGCGAHLAALRRTRSGGLDVAAATTLAALEAMSETERDAMLRPADTLVAGYTPITLTPDDAGRFLSGVRRRLPLADMPLVRVYGTKPPAFLGTGHVAGGELIATRLLSPVEAAAVALAPAPARLHEELESLTP